MQLPNHTVLLTGASGGIGMAIAEKLAEAGCHLVLALRKPEKSASLVRHLRRYPIRVQLATLDLASPDVPAQAQAILRQFPQIDMLVNCAGVNTFAAVDKPDAEALSTMLDINLRGTILLTQSVIAAFREKEHACIVNVGSTFGSIGYPGFAAYCASKFGLRGFTEALRRELADSRVQVCYVAPRATQTTMNSPEVQQMNAELRVAMDPPEVVANAVLHAIQKNRSATFIGWPEKVFVVVNAVLTRLVDNALAKQLPIIQRYLLPKESHHG